jgi:hypothetical protein
MQRIKNIKDLRNDLLDIYDKSKTNEELKVLQVKTACASAVIRSCKTELDYNKVKNNDKKIDFLDVD